MTEETADYTPPERYTILSNEAPAEAADVDQVPANEEVEAAEQEPEVESEPEQRKKDAQSRIRELANTNRELKERLAALEEAKAQPVIAPAEKPNPADFVGGKFNDDYQDAIRAYDRAEITASIKAELYADQQKTTIEAEKAKVIERENVFKDSHPDYDDALSAVMNAGIVDGGIADALIDLDNGFDIVYKIGNDEDLLYQLAAMTPAQRLMKIGALSAQSSGTTAPPAAKISQAAKPITPVSGGKTVLTGAAAIEAAEKAMDYDAWKAAKAAK
jgi:hypothetical protein